MINVFIDAITPCLSPTHVIFHGCVRALKTIIKLQKKLDIKVLADICLQLLQKNQSTLVLTE